MFPEIAEVAAVGHSARVTDIERLAIILEKISADKEPTHPELLTARLGIAQLGLSDECKQLASAYRGLVIEEVGEE